MVYQLLKKKCNRNLKGSKVFIMDAALKVIIRAALWFIMFFTIGLSLLLKLSVSIVIAATKTHCMYHP